LFPDSTWGRRVVVTPFGDRPAVPSVVRILALQDGTTLAFDPPSVAPTTTVLSARKFVQFETNASFVVTANRPILVAQFMYGGGTDTDEGDPAMVYEVPVEQYRREYTFLTPATYTHNYANIVGPRGAPPWIDGAAVTAYERPVGQSGLSAWTVELPAGVHRLGSSTANGSLTYGIKVYGTATFTSYAYPGGLDLEVIEPG
jgi:hypothetical protein